MYVSSVLHPSAEESIECYKDKSGSSVRYQRRFAALVCSSAGADTVTARFWEHKEVPVADSEVAPCFSWSMLQGFSEYPAEASRD